MFTPYFMWDFIVWVVCEREGEDSSLHWRRSGFHGYLASKLPAGIWWQLVFASILWVRPSPEIPAKHFVLLFWLICSTISSPILYIPTLPSYCEECFLERKPKQTQLRVRNCYTYNHLHNPLWFSSYSYLSISISLRGW